ncbi:hypothetical protein [Paraburkholderia caribensis]|uniref:hypothetical protein n=1 Tax=Paraburkholderia caribensis TaxID=75105 RepID=UPI00078C53D1|nr:hypothetical protein [Paraburkholderia caribensis]AMV44569.1 hypothetical protein ATN79_21725 [Paraburkholderia caribensis]
MTYVPKPNAYSQPTAAGRNVPVLRAGNLIIQPLLDQFVEFATENLVILLGQQPNAHFIFMDQNQLSAYVQQEPYPLFSHEVSAHESEFHELVRRTFQKTLKFDTSFVDSIYEETGGHPFLAINLLRDFVDWLIVKKVIPNNTPLTGALFKEYAVDGLSRAAIGRSRHYHYFRSAASEALSKDSMAQSPWIYAAYKLLRHLTPHQMRCGSLSKYILSCMHGIPSVEFVMRNRFPTSSVQQPPEIQEVLTSEPTELRAS